MRNPLPLTATALLGLLAAVPAGAAPAASPTQSVVRLAAQLAGRARTDIATTLARAGFRAACDLFATPASLQDAGDLKVCFTEGRWAYASIRFPHIYGHPTFHALKRDFDREYGSPARTELSHFIGGPETAVWHVAAAHVTVRLAREWPSKAIEIKIFVRSQ